MVMNDLIKDNPGTILDNSIRISHLRKDFQRSRVILFENGHDFLAIYPQNCWGSYLYQHHDCSLKSKKYKVFFLLYNGIQRIDCLLRVQ